LFVGLVAGLASIGLLIVLIVAVWPSGKGEKATGAGEKLVVASAPVTDWQEVISHEGQFRVFMPGAPRIKDSVVHTVLGSLAVKAYDIDFTNCELSVWYGDLDSEELCKVSPEDWIDASRQIYIARSNARLLSEKNLSLHSNLGKEWRFEISPGKVIRRTYDVNRRIYTLNIFRHNQDPPEDVVNRFFDSFQVLD
jgi:hypothetical protein